MNNSNKTVLFYVYHSDMLTKEDSTSYKVHNLMVLPALKEVKGYIDVYAFDCLHPLL